MSILNEVMGLLEVLIILVDVLLTVWPGLNVLCTTGDGAESLLSTETAELPAEENGQRDGEPGVAQEGHGELDRKGNITVSVAETEDHGEGEEKGEDWEHPNSGPELSFFTTKLLSQTEPKQWDRSNRAVGQS